MSVFLDTNILIYAFTDDPRSGKAQELVIDGRMRIVNPFSAP